MKQTYSIFEGFTPEAIQFLADLKQNNNREWFNERKEFYEKEIKLKAQWLIAEMQYVFAQEGLNFTVDVKKSMFRIYRDIRFSKNKEPYKTHIGLFFPFTSDGKWHKPVEVPGLYLHIEPDMMFIAGGLHRPLPQQLKAIRTKLTEDWEEFNDIINDVEFKREFPDGLTKESLKRVPAGFPKDHPAADLLKLKTYTTASNINNDIIYNRKLIDVLIGKAQVITPFLEFLSV